MENSGNKKAPEELTDEMLDKITGGADTPDKDAILAWAMQFGMNNCLRCKGMTTSQCSYYHGPVDVYLMGLKASDTCPGFIS